MYSCISLITATRCYDCYQYIPWPSPIKRGRSPGCMCRIPQISCPPIPKGLSLPSVWVLGFGDCRRRPAERLHIWRDRVHCMGSGGSGICNSSVMRRGIGPALSHRPWNLQGQLCSRYTVLSVWCFVRHVRRIRQLIDPVQLPFSPVRLPSSAVRVSVWLTTELDVRAKFPASTSCESPCLDDSHRLFENRDHQYHCRLGYLYIVGFQVRHPDHCRGHCHQQSRPQVRPFELCVRLSMPSPAECHHSHVCQWRAIEFE